MHMIFLFLFRQAGGLDRVTFSYKTNASDLLALYALGGAAILYVTFETTYTLICSENTGLNS